MVHDPSAPPKAVRKPSEPPTLPPQHNHPQCTAPPAWTQPSTSCQCPCPAGEGGESCAPSSRGVSLFSWFDSGRAYGLAPFVPAMAQPASHRKACIRIHRSATPRPARGPDILTQGPTLSPSELKYPTGRANGRAGLLPKPRDPRLGVRISIGLLNRPFQCPTGQPQA